MQRGGRGEMTLAHKLTKMLKKKVIIPKCIYPKCHLVRVEDEWIECNKNYGYKYYSGSLCPEHLQEALIYNKVQSKLMKRTSMGRLWE